MAVQKQKKGGSKKVGRNKAKCEQYRKRMQKEKRAMRHMLKSNRYEDVVAYAIQHNLKAPPQPVKHISTTRQLREYYNQHD